MLVQIFGQIVDNCDLEGEFNLLAMELSEMVASATTVQNGVVIVAFTHARIVAAQPAEFGNKRTAMCLALSQVRALFRMITNLNPFDMNAYYVALDEKINEGRSDRLNGVFGQILNIPGPFLRALPPLSRSLAEHSRLRRPPAVSRRILALGSRLG